MQEPTSTELTPAPPTAPLPGQGRVLAGRYELGAPLGSGGMATVVLAHDRVLGREVAVKLLRDQYAANADFRARFTREAVHASRLSHHGLVTIFDAGVDDGTAFIVMELVRGRTLREILTTDGPLPVDRAVEIAAAICEVLDVTHLAGVVHRDIKPGNVAISADGRTRVFDFGIARIEGADPLTRTATVMGTASYISPEQAAGQAAGPQSDLYAVGCVLFELLTGSAPFTADTPLGLLYQHVNDTPPSPSAQRPDVPSSVDAVVSRLLAKDPADRPATAGQARAELLAAVSQDRGTTQVLPRLPAEAVGRQAIRRPSRRLMLGIVALATTLLLLLGLFLHRGTTNAVVPLARPSSSSVPKPSPSAGAVAPVRLTVPVATTQGGAIAALRSVIEAGQSALLIDRTAADQLTSTLNEISTGPGKKNEKSNRERVRALQDLVPVLIGQGHIIGAAVLAVTQAASQLARLVDRGD